MAAAPAETFDVVMRKAPVNVLAKWQTIQDEMPSFPVNALRDLIAEMSQALAEAGNSITPELLAIVDDWYRRALATRANRLNPAEPILTREAWEGLPKDWA